MTPLTVDLSTIHAARVRIQPAALLTPLLPYGAVDGPRPDLLLKCENLQRTGSFKIRGAYNRIAELSAEERSRGVIAYSSGNHAQGVACAAALLGVAATVVMPENAVPAKVAATRRYGATILFAGTDSETRRQRAEQLAAEGSLALVPPYDHPAIIAGQATIGLEVLEQCPEVETILVPVGGGGLLAGIALAVKLTRPAVRVIGVEPEGAADGGASFRRGELVSLPAVSTIADGLRATHLGALPFALIREYVDDMIAVDDEAILRATRAMLFSSHVVAEPSGAVSVAAALAGGGRGRTVAVVSGGNIDPALLRV
jgi:threonine dehydratase